MRLYIRTRSKDRIGNAGYRWHSIDLETKAAAKKRFGGGFYGTVKDVLTEEQLVAQWGEANAEAIKKSAFNW